MLISGSQAAAKFIKREVVILFDGLADELPGLVVESRLATAGVRQGIGGAGLAVAAQEVLDRGETDAEQLGDFGQSVLAAFVSFDDAVA